MGHVLRERLRALNREIPKNVQALVNRSRRPCAGVWLRALSSLDAAAVGYSIRRYSFVNRTKGQALEVSEVSMTLHRTRTIPCFLRALCAFASGLASAQTAPWTAPLRGWWVQMGPPAQGDVILAGRDRAS